MAGRVGRWLTGANRMAFTAVAGLAGFSAYLYFSRGGRRRPVLVTA